MRRHRERVNVGTDPCDEARVRTAFDASDGAAAIEMATRQA